MGQFKWKFGVKIVAFIDLIISAIVFVSGFIIIPVVYVTSILPEIGKCPPKNETSPLPEIAFAWFYQPPKNATRSSHCEDDIMMSYLSTIVIVSIIIYVTFWAALELRNATQLKANLLSVQEDIYTWLMFNVIFTLLIIPLAIDAMHFELFTVIIIIRLVLIYVVMKFLEEVEYALTEDSSKHEQEQN